MKTTLVNLLLVLKNASELKKEKIICSYNRSFINILKGLYKEGFISYFKVSYNDTQPLKIIIGLRYSYGKILTINTLKFLSTPSQLSYLAYKDICKISDKKIVLFFSTNIGILTQLECKKNRVGGSPLFLIS
jgi:small subunit ribosomal protein S8